MYGRSNLLYYLSYTNILYYLSYYISRQVIGEGVVRSRSARQERTYDKESYIDFRMRLLGDPDQGPSVLSPGIHSFPFKLGLPLGLPSTFLGRYGWIQYYCKAALREPSGLIHKNHQVFIVMNPIDLNLEQPVLAVSIAK